MTRLAVLFAVVLGFSTPAHATDIFSVQGAWTGSGLLPTGAETPLQPGRCQFNIVPKPDGDDVSVTGNCFVSVAVSDVSMRIVRRSGGRVNAGFWTAAAGQTVQYSGTSSATTIDMASTTDLVLDDKPYESQVRVSTPDAGSLAIRVLLRAPGAEAWRLFADITLHRADG